MTIQTTKTGSEATILLQGRLDTMTAPQLEAELRQTIPGLRALTLDFGGLDYLSSAGLRVLRAVAGAEAYEPAGPDEADPRQPGDYGDPGRDRLYQYPHHRTQRPRVSSRNRGVKYRTVHRTVLHRSSAVPTSKHNTPMQIRNTQTGSNLHRRVVYFVLYRGRAMLAPTYGYAPPL